MSEFPVRIYNFFDTVLSPMPADKTAKGSIPASGFQYCEALTAASSFGHYIFPPMDAKLRWTGSHIQFQQDGKWHDLDQMHLPQDCQNRWREIAPAEHEMRLPPFLQRFFVPEIVQVWTGLFVTCDPNWSILIRPISNAIRDERIMMYEGLVEADVFKPLPLFVNIRFLSLNDEVRLERFNPLFQLQPLPRISHAGSRIEVVSPTHAKAEDLETFPWEGLAQTTRLFSGAAEDLELGAYKKLVRSRRRRDQS